MDNQLKYKILFEVQDGKIFGTINKLTKGIGDVDNGAKKLKKTFSDSLNDINNKLKTIKFDSMLNNMERVANGLTSINEPGMKLSTSMYDLQAITGLTGKKLQEVEGYARENAKTFGGSAAEGVEGFKLILSQLSPEIGKVPVALNSMGKSVSTLSKTMGGDTLAATEVLTTAMNQFQVSTDDPIAASKKMSEMMNIMAASAKEGSAELPQIKQALEQSGMAAKGANVSFAETNAAIQVLDKAGKKGSEGGVALRNVMATLSEGRFLPKDIKQELSAAGIDINALGDKSKSLTQRLAPLRGIMNDSALFTKLFGKENSNAALAVVSGITEIDRLTGAVQGTNTAYEQAAIIMESPAEKQARLQASVDDFKISVFNASGGMLGYAQTIGTTMNDMAGLIPLFSGVASTISFLSSKQKIMAFWTNVVSVSTSIWAGVQSILNAAFWANPITWVVAGIIALIAVITYVVSKTEGWGKAWQYTVEGAKLLWKAFVAAIKLYFTATVNSIMMGLDLIKMGWYEFKDAVGIGDSSENQAILSQIHRDIEARKNAIVDGGKEVLKLSLAAGEKFKLAAGSIKWKPKAKEEEGITQPGMPGVVDAGGGGGGGGAKPPGGKDATNSITTGGTKSTTVNIQIGNLVNEMKINAGNVKESAGKIRDIIVDELTRAVSMGGALGGN